MNKSSFKKIVERDDGSNFDSVAEFCLRDIRHPSTYSKKLLSQIATKAMVIIGEEGQKRVISDPFLSEGGA